MKSLCNYIFIKHLILFYISTGSHGSRCKTSFVQHHRTKKHGTILLDLVKIGEHIP